MPLEKYQEKAFRQKSLDMIDAAKEIIASYQATDNIDCPRLAGIEIEGRNSSNPNRPAVPGRIPLTYSRDPVGSWAWFRV